MYSLFKNINDWTHFKYELSKLDAKAKGNAFERLVQFYLQISPLYKTKLKNVWLFHEIPAKIVNLLNLPSSDKGIDLIAETYRGEYWSIQCKYRENESQSLKWSEIATFSGLSFAHCKNIIYGLVCTTTDRITSLLKKQDNIGFCCIDVWMDLDEQFFNQIKSLIDSQQFLRPAPLHPLPHQERAIQNAYKHFAQEGQTRGKLIMPCGTGKSLAAYWIAEKLEAKEILIAVPSLALMRQTLRVWLRELISKNINVDWVCVCSDETVGKIEKDDLAVLKQDLGIPCITDNGKIADWLRTRQGELNIVFTTYQSGKSIAKAARELNISFDIGILDEAHKTVGESKKLYSHLLYDENIKIHRRLFMTATERRYIGDSEKIASMDDEELYGDTFEMLSFKAALESKPPILSDYRIITINVTKSQVAELIEKNIFIRPDNDNWDKEVEAKMLASLIAIRKAMLHYPIKHAVSFHSSIKRSKIFRDNQDKFSCLFSEYGELDTFHVSGNTPTGERMRILRDFKQSSRGLVTNARCLTEGVDVPDIDCILFADPRRSAIDIVQAVGRALRLSKNKSYGYVILPIIVDDDLIDVNDLSDNEDFKEILRVLRALASNDERIIEYFRAVTQGRKPASENLISIDFDDVVAHRFDLNEFVRHIELTCWNRLARLSWRPFEEARDFVRLLKLKGSDVWKDYCRGDLNDKPLKPNDIPTAPNQVYRDKGWSGMGDWLGTGTIATQNRQYRNFEKAREFVRSLGLKGEGEWRDYKRGELKNKPPKPEDIPAAPECVYKDHGWSGWGDWIGTGTIAARERQYKSFNDARDFVRLLGLKGKSEWSAYCKYELRNKPPKPDDIPAAPNQVYRDEGWIGWGDWFGTMTSAPSNRYYRDFHQAREFARKLGLLSVKDWRKYYKGELADKPLKPDDIPVNPDRSYRDSGWSGWGDFLGIASIATRDRKYRTFKDAREYIRTIGISSVEEWKKYCREELNDKSPKPYDIPAAPDVVFRDSGWTNWGDFLGTGTVAPFNRVHRDFEKAREFARSLKLKSQKQWVEFCRGKRTYLPQKPEDIPAAPESAYKNSGWSGYGDWLGTGVVATQNRQYRNFEEARNYIQSLGLKSMNEWRVYCKGELIELSPKPDDIPASPERVYKDNWKGWGDWLRK
ncbi:MAG: DEAD/DEAH box helicase family protein [Candidatus Xenobiia bacterium LiM19]